MNLCKLSLKLLLRNMKRLIISSVLLFLFISPIILNNIFQYSSYETEGLKREQIYGSWTHAQLNVSKIDESQAHIYKLNSDKPLLESFDDKMFELSNLNISEGRLPTNQNEVVVEKTFLGNNQLDDEVEFTIQGESHVFKIVGVIEDYGIYFSGSHSISGQRSYHYPNFITTGLSSERVTEFYINRNLKSSDANGFLLNDKAYPLLNFEQVDMIQYLSARKLNLDKSVKAVNFLLSTIAVIMLFIVHKSNVEFFNDKVRNLRQLGISKISGIFVLIIHNIFYVLVIGLSGVIVGLLSFLIISLFKNIRFSFNFNLALKTILIIGIVSILIHSCLVIITIVSQDNINQNIVCKKSIARKMMLTQGVSLLIGLFFTIVVVFLSHKNYLEEYKNFEIVQQQDTGINTYRLMKDDSFAENVYFNISEIEKLRTLEGYKSGHYFNQMLQPIKISYVKTVALLPFDTVSDLNLNPVFKNESSVYFNPIHPQLESFNEISINGKNAMNLGAFPINVDSSIDFIVSNKLASELEILTNNNESITRTVSIDILNYSYVGVELGLENDLEFPANSFKYREAVSDIYKDIEHIEVNGIVLKNAGSISKSNSIYLDIMVTKDTANLIGLDTNSILSANIEFDSHNDYLPIEKEIYRIGSGFTLQNGRLYSGLLKSEVTVPLFISIVTLFLSIILFIGVTVIQFQNVLLDNQKELKIQ